MPHLSISLFGSITCTTGDDVAVRFAYDKVQALLAYLATESNRPQRREVLAGLLWPDQEESVARHNLNQALWSLRRSINDRDLIEPLLVSSRDSLQLSPEADCLIDVHRFRTLLDNVERHVHRRQEACPACTEWLIEAAELYHGPFLAQISLADSPEFEDWVVTCRERFHQMAVDALERLVDQLEHQHEYQRAIAYLRRLLQLDPWREDSHRRLMRLLARAGQRPAALAHFDRVRQILERDLGADVEQETIDLRDEIERGDRGESNGEPREVVPSPATALPASAAPLVGREQILSELSSLIASGQHRLITLIGPGGIGKTSLALQLARDEEHSFRHGARFMPLAGTASSESLVQVIADACSLPVYGTSDVHEQLMNRLREQDLLLVLDNFEHLLSGASVVSDILAVAPRVQVVVTSRERLNLYGEYVVPVTALDIPSIMDAPSDIGRASSVQLFVRSAERANSSFQLRASDFPAIIHTCELVGGMPLGIELAAAWTPLLSCQEIAAEIEKSLDFLSTSLRDVPERHRSMRAAFDHSWRMLTETERRIFTRLSVFRGGFLKDAAEQITGSPLPVLLTLMSKSFLVRNPHGRFEIHELLRQYAEDHLKQDPLALREARVAHASYFVTFLHDREQKLKGREYVPALQELIAETENIRATWAWALEDRDVELLETLSRIWLFYEVSGRYQELADAQDRAIAVLESCPGPRAEVALACALTRRAALRMRVGDLIESEANLLRSGHILQRHGEYAEAGLNLNLLAMKAHAMGDQGEEQRILDESIKLCRLSGDRWTLAYSLNDLGMVECLREDLVEAERLIRESHDIFVAMDDARGTGFALNNLGIVNCRRGAYDEALRFHRESLRIRRLLNNLWGAAQSLTQMGIVARLMGDEGGSETHLSEALWIAHELQAYPLILDALMELVELYLMRGDRDIAVPIVASIVQHPACGLPIIARAQQIREEVGQSAGTTTESSALPANLDDVIAQILKGESALIGRRPSPIEIVPGRR